MDLMRNLLGLWIGRLLNAAPTVEASTTTARDPRGVPFEPSNASRFCFALYRPGTSLLHFQRRRPMSEQLADVCFQFVCPLSSVIFSFRSIDHLEICHQRFCVPPIPTSHGQSLFVQPRWKVRERRALILCLAELNL